MGLPLRLSTKESTCNAGDVGSIPESRRSPGRMQGNPFQYSCQMKETVESQSGMTEVIEFILCCYVLLLN